MKKSIPVILLALLAGASATAGADQARVIIKCRAGGDDCHKQATPSTPPAPSAAPTLPPDRPGGVELGMSAAPIMMAPPSLAAPSMPPAPAVAMIPDSAHAACVGRKAGSRMTVKLGKNTSVQGVCEKESGKMRFRARERQHAG